MYHHQNQIPNFTVHKRIFLILDDESNSHPPCILILKHQGQESPSGISCYFQHFAMCHHSALKSTGHRSRNDARHAKLSGPKEDSLVKQEISFCDSYRLITRLTRCDRQSMAIPHPERINFLPTRPSFLMIRQGAYVGSIYESLSFIPPRIHTVDSRAITYNSLVPIPKIQHHESVLTSAVRQGR
jgi:hypothetical protein